MQMALAHKQPKNPSSIMSSRLKDSKIEILTVEESKGKSIKNIENDSVTNHSSKSNPIPIWFSKEPLRF